MCIYLHFMCIYLCVFICILCVFIYVYLSAFYLPVKSGLKSYKYKKPSDKTLHMLRNKYQYLNVLIIDEISIIGRDTSGHLNVSSKVIMQNSSPFHGVSLLAVGDFFTTCTF